MWICEHRVLIKTTNQNYVIKMLHCHKFLRSYQRRLEAVDVTCCIYHSRSRTCIQISNQMAAQTFSQFIGFYCALTNRDRYAYHIGIITQNKQSYPLLKIETTDNDTRHFVMILCGYDCWSLGDSSRQSDQLCIEQTTMHPECKYTYRDSANRTVACIK